MVGEHSVPGSKTPLQASTRYPRPSRPAGTSTVGAAGRLRVQCVGWGPSVKGWPPVGPGAASSLVSSGLP